MGKLIRVHSDSIYEYRDVSRDVLNTLIANEKVISIKSKFGKEMYFFKNPPLPNIKPTSEFYKLPLRIRYYLSTWMTDNIEVYRHKYGEKYLHDLDAVELKELFIFSTKLEFKD